MCYGQSISDNVSEDSAIWRHLILCRGILHVVENQRWASIFPQISVSHL